MDSLFYPFPTLPYLTSWDIFASEYANQDEAFILQLALSIEAGLFYKTSTIQ